jgi:LysR family transcriptional regulator, hydrogen peroxide-inducible genes activator
MADILRGAHSAAQLELGNFAPDTVSVDAIRLMAGMGRGVAFLPALHIRSEIGGDETDVKVVEIEGPRILRSVGLVTRSGSADEAAPRIARLIQAVAREVFAGVLAIEPI